MKNTTLSTCLIVKNEEENLARCLRSIQFISDEIIVVDTGSTDNTIEIAKSFGEKVKVIEYEWKNDFSDARNKSLEYATKDWILFLDADEDINFQEGEKLLGVINNPQNKIFEGYYLRLVNFIDNKEHGDAIVFRMFKNDPDYRFVGKMHEQVIRAVEEKSGKNSIGSTDIRINHYGYDPNVADQMEKCKRNISLLLNYDEKDKDGYYYYSLGNEYIRLGNNDTAMDMFNKAIDYTYASNGVIPIYYPYLMVSVMNILNQQRKFKRSLEYIQFFKKGCKDFKDIYLQEGVIYLERAEFSKSLKAFKTYNNLKSSKTNYVYPDNVYNQYDIPHIINQLKLLAIQQDEDLISSMILYNKQTNTIIETVKTLSEISKEIIVVLSKGIYIDKDEIENLGAIIVQSDSTEEDRMYFDGLIKCKGKYVLKMKLGELLCDESKKQIVKLLEKNKKDLFEVNILNEQNIFVEKSLRVFKNNKKFKKYDQLIKHIESKKIDEADFTIHKRYDIYNEVCTKREDIMNSKITEFEMVDIYEKTDQDKKILISSKVSSDLEKVKEFLKNQVKISDKYKNVEYYFIGDLQNKEGIDIIDELAKDVDCIYKKNIENLIEKTYKSESIEYAIENQYDYLCLLGESSKIEENTFNEFIGFNKDIVIQNSNDEQKQVIFISREALLAGVNFDEIKMIQSNNDIVNICIRAEVLGMEVVKM